MSALFDTFKRAGSDFSQDDCMSSGAAMAYYAIFSLPPLLILVGAIAHYFGVEPERIQNLVQDQLGVAAGGEELSGQLKQGAGGGQGKGGSPGLVWRVVGVVVLVFSATGLFAQLQYTLNRVWEVKPDPNQGGVLAFLGKRFLSLGMILIVVFLLLISLVLTTIIDDLIKYVQGGAAEGTSVVLGVALNSFVIFVVAAMLFAAMFKVLPDATIAWRDVWFGALVTALLFVIGKSLIALYVQKSDLGSGWGTAAASLIGVLVWLYYSSLIVLFGAELTQAWAGAHGRKIEPAPGAVPADEVR